MAQRILITAIAAGFCKEIDIAFAKNGAKVFNCDIDTKALEMTAQKLPELVTKVCDVLNLNAVEVSGGFMTF